jgi:hypothetical protein
MSRPVKLNHGRLNQTHCLSVPETQIITGAASIASQNLASSPAEASTDKLVDLELFNGTLTPAALSHEGLTLIGDRRLVKSKANWSAHRDMSGFGLGCVKTRRRSIAMEEVIRPRPF